MNMWARLKYMWARLKCFCFGHDFLHTNTGILELCYRCGWDYTTCPPTPPRK